VSWSGGKLRLLRTKAKRINDVGEKKIAFAEIVFVWFETIERVIRSRSGEGELCGVSLELSQDS
jgi:hypothetical protein